MAQSVTLYNLLISCPGDIKEEVTSKNNPDIIEGTLNVQN